MRMKFLRILPETCARTWCLFSSSTRNIALGSGSITVAMTSMASSLEFPESPFFFSSRIGRAIVSRCIPWDRHSCLSYFLRRSAGDRQECLSYHDSPVISFRRVKIHGPLAVTATVCSKCAEGLPCAASGVSVVRQVGLVVHPRADAVPDKVAHHRKTVLLHPTLHRVADIAEPVARPHLVDRAIQRFAGYIQQLLHFRPNLPHRNSHRRIPVVAVHFHPEINRDDIAFAQLPLRRRNPVNDLAVHRRAQQAGITAISLERRLARSSGDFFLCKLLEVHRRD